MSKLRILIVEDDPDIAGTLADYLEIEGYDSKIAINGQEALDFLALAEKLPSVILLDLMMPVLNGVEFCHRQSEDARIKHLPVILMSADAQIEEKFKQVDAKAFVKKPPKLDVLLNLIETYALRD